MIQTNSDHLGKKILASVGWVSLATYVGAVMSFGGNIMLARLLLPEDFGTYTFASSLLLLIFMIAGFGSQESIVQCRDPKIQHLVSTSYWITLGLGVVLATIGTALGLFVIRAYDIITGALIIWLSWTKLISMIGYVYRAILQRDINYRPLAIINIITNILSLILAIIAAFFGWGIWSLLVRESSQMILLLIGLIWVSQYHLEFIFDKQAAVWIWNFGWKMMSHRIGEEIFERADKLAIGSFLGTTMLGQYSIANRLAILGHQFSQGMVEPVAYSTFAAVQDSPHKLQTAFHRFYYWLFRLTLFFFLIVWLQGREIVSIFYGEKWQLAGIVFQHMAPLMALIPLNKGISTMLIASGRVNAVLRVRVWQLLFFIPTLIITAFFGDLLVIVWVVNLGFLLLWLLQMRALSSSISIEWYQLMYSAVAAIVMTFILAIVTKTILGDHISGLIGVIVGAATVVGAYTISLLLFERQRLLTEWSLIQARLT
ncbi:MAG: oligosaccharide flippase family protein [Caldilineaceae bacterium]